MTSALPLWSLSLSANGRRPVSTKLDLMSRQVLMAAWPRREAVSLVERRDPAGRLVMRIDHHADAGYLVAAPGHGMHVISNDGCTIQSALPNAPRWRWQRLLFAQALPLAAALQGHALLHASSVALGGRAFGFIAPSGIGKSSVAAHLIAMGARFVTDDVLAVQRDADRLPAAQPGPAWTSLTPGELRSIPESARARLGVAVGRSSEKIFLELPPVSTPLPLGGVYFLERGLSTRSLRIEDVPAPRAERLLASSFLWYLASPEHLLTHLDVSAQIAASVPMFDVRIPLGVTAAHVAAALKNHAGGGP